MYNYPQHYKCNKCDHEFMYGEHDPWNTPVLEEQEQIPKVGTVTHALPVCPKCWEQFLKTNLGLGYGTTDWGYGTYYDKKVKK